MGTLARPSGKLIGLAGWHGDLHTFVIMYCKFFGASLSLSYLWLNPLILSGYPASALYSRGIRRDRGDNRGQERDRPGGRRRRRVNKLRG